MGENTPSAGIKLAQILRDRFEERRNGEIAGLLRLLSSSNPAQLPLEYLTKMELQKKARDLYVRLYWSPAEGQEADDGKEQEQPREKRSKLEELHSFLEENEEKVVESKFSSPSDISEMVIFENTNKRPAILDLIFRAIKTMPPTSIEAERAFSAAGLFLTKLHSRLSDTALDYCCFLRKYLKNIQ